ncbi:MAG TPA: hypothetical protein VIT42_13925 [Microlunatus sp.]
MRSTRQVSDADGSGRSMHCPPQAPHHVHARPLGVGAGRSVAAAGPQCNGRVQRVRPHRRRSSPGSPAGTEHDEFLAAQFDVLDDDELHQLATLWAKVSDPV